MTTVVHMADLVTAIPTSLAPPRVSMPRVAQTVDNAMPKINAFSKQT